MTHLHPRRLARKVAKAQYDKAGATGYNKPRILNGMLIPSRFSQDWRNVAAMTLQRGGSK